MSPLSYQPSSTALSVPITSSLRSYHLIFIMDVQRLDTAAAQSCARSKITYFPNKVEVKNRLTHFSFSSLPILRLISSNRCARDGFFGLPLVDDNNVQFGINVTFHDIDNNDTSLLCAQRVAKQRCLDTTSAHASSLNFPPRSDGSRPCLCCLLNHSTRICTFIWDAFGCRDLSVLDMRDRIFRGTLVTSKALFKLFFKKLYYNVGFISN